MSEILEKARAQLESKFANANFDSSVKFVINNEGAISVNAGKVTIANDDADMTMTADAEVFEDILAGNLDGASAFMSGKLQIDGDMSLAMQLGQVLSS